MSNQPDELFEYLQKIAHKSRQGDIPWNQPNPSTFQWVQDKGDDAFYVTIQKADKPLTLGDFIDENKKRRNSTYLFQVQDRRTKQTLISLSSKERPELNDVLDSIFKGAEKGMDIRASDVLKQLLGN